MKETKYRMKMSDHIPPEIQIHIIKHLPVNSLIRFRSVSKQWKSLIDSSHFINDYSLRHAHQPHRHIVSYHDPETCLTKYVSFVDEQSFAPTVPLMDRRLSCMTIVASSGGLLCLAGFHQEPGHPLKNVAVLWNPSIKKSIGIVVPYVLLNFNETRFGFWVCPQTSDPRVLNIRKMSLQYGASENRGSSPWQIKVFTLSSRTWRSLCSNLPRDSVVFTNFQVDIDGSTYWFAFERANNMILSFDWTSEEFGEISLPHSLVIPEICRTLSISRLRESLAVLEYRRDAGNEVCVVWMMEFGVPNSFTKLFNVHAPQADINKVLGFMKSGELMVEVQDDDKEVAVLSIYEPNSQQIKHLGIHGRSFTFFMGSYMETLLLLDHKDGSIY